MIALHQPGDDPEHSFRRGHRHAYAMAGWSAVETLADEAGDVPGVARSIEPM